jgi:hypothetical protein
MSGVSSVPGVPETLKRQPRAWRPRRGHRTVLVALLIVALCGSCCVGCREALVGDVIVADKPDLDRAAIKAARADAETRMGRNLTTARPPGTAVVADARQAACYPGNHSLKLTTPYDNVCISRHVVYLAVQETKVDATLETIHLQLAKSGWTAQSPDLGSDRLILLRGGAEQAPTGPDRSLHEAEYARDRDHLSFRFGPPTASALTDAAAWQNVAMYAFTPPYWFEKHQITAAELGAATRKTGASVLVAVASEQTWFRNGGQS